MKSFRQFMEDIGNRGKDWFDLPRSTADAFTSRVVKRRGKPKSSAILNDTGMAPHSPRKTTIMQRP